MADKHFVVQGAACKCNFGSAPDQLKVDVNDREYINDGDGSTKAIASNKDVGQPFQAKTFGSCSVTRSSCNPAVTQWEGVYQKVTLTNGGKILTEDSKAICTVSGSPCISITNHGQSAAVTSAHFDKVEVESLAALNPMAPKPANNKEIPQVNTIKVKLEKRIPVTEINSHKKKTDPIPVITVRVDESLTFTVNDYHNPAKADKEKVSWKVFNGNNFDGTAQSFEEIGPSYKINFDAVGQYRVMAYGKDGTDSRSSLDIIVATNKLKNEFSLGSGVGRIVDSLSTHQKEYRIRRGVPVTLEAIYEMMPATADEKQRVSMQVTDGNGNIVAGPTAAGTDKITFTPANTAASYRVTATMVADSPDGQPQEVSRDMVSEVNGVAKVTNDQNAAIIRPRTTMSFKAAEMVYKTQVQDFEAAAIKWQLNGQEVGTGTSISLDGNTYFTRPGNYVVEAYVMKADAWDAQKGKPSAKHQLDDWRFEVKNNEVLKIEVEGGAINWVVGKRYNLIAKTTMPYNAQLDGPITWVPANSSSDRNENVFAPHKGKIWMSAKLGFSAQRLEINADYATITRWCFADQESIYKPRAGWKETIKALITSTAAAGEKVNIHILEADSGSDFNYIKDMGEVTFDAQGEAKLDIQTDTLKPMLSKLYFEGEFYDVLFAILQKPGGIEFADMKSVASNGKKFWFPKKQSNQRDLEMGKYVYIREQKEIVSVHFFDSSNYPAYKVYKYGEKIKIHIQTRNMAGEELTLQLWENKYKEKDLNVLELKDKVKENEILDIDIDTNKLKSGKKAIDDTFRCFYAVIKSDKADKYMYPQEIADKNILNPSSVSFYQHIKLSNSIADRLNQITKPVAPTVLGEALEKEETTTGCPRCNEKITPATLLKIFPKAENATLQAVADTYNKYMKEIGMNTCWNKAHFFAQAIVETGDTLHLKDGENFNWYWEGLVDNFGAFQTIEGQQKAHLWGRANKIPIHPGVTDENQKNIANYAYGPDAAKGKEIGNTTEGDGWNFRGKGLIQITGRTVYAYANTYTKRENADIILNPDLVISDIKIAVLSSMAFWKLKGLQNASNGNTEVTERISKKVGKDVISDGKSSHAEKKLAFANTTSVLFRVKECQYGIVPAGDNNKYKIDADTFTYSLIQANASSTQFQYDVYVGGALVKTYVIEKNTKNLLPFPETGPNWGRYGTRDGGDDNYIDPKVAAALIGYFYSLPKNGYSDKLYFNDISASDKRNLGHHGHVDGNDIDIRYPGSPATGGNILWSDAKEAYPSEEKFVEALENLLTISGKWGFNTNYAYKDGLKNTMGTAMTAHQNHFHLGLR
ncbi:putative chitinase [Chitinophaga niastensis]|uniref:Putative chitinase n=1 Tax=Chitinophaga niastensis TaxID=536980 RepID=A0A2P8HU07_CHINA|nr:PAAR-like protein [Chitinophaga niastensis]PSL49719.1 putative chitinase [Chitinophaga niastensis]